jgi:hypothetical protein
MNKSGGCDEECWQARRPWCTSATSENEQFKVDIPGNLFREVNPTFFLSRLKMSNYSNMEK